MKSSRSQMFFKIGVLKKFAIFTGKHLCWCLFLIKLQVWRPETLLTKDSNTGFSCEYCEIFKNSFLYRTPPVVHHKRFYNKERLLSKITLSLVVKITCSMLCSSQGISSAIRVKRWITTRQSAGLFKYTEYLFFVLS